VKNQDQDLGPIGEQLRRQFGTEDGATVLAKAQSTDVIGEADELTEQLGSKLAAYKALASDHADTLGAIAQELARLNRELPGWRTEPGALSRMGHDLESEFKRISEENQFALREFQQRKDARREQQYKERRQAFTDAVTRVRETATIKTLHDACAPGASGTFALRREVPILDDNGKPLTFRDGRGTEKTRTRTVWDLFRICDGTAQMVDSTSRNAVERFGDKAIPLNPPTFRTDRGQPFFPRTVQDALVSLWSREEERDQIHEEIQGLLDQRDPENFSFRDLVAGKKGVAAAHFRTWRMKGQQGRLTVVVTSTGKNASLTAFISPAFSKLLEPVIGAKVPVAKLTDENLDRDEEPFETLFLNNLARARISYEERVANRAETAEDLNEEDGEEPADEAEQTADA